MICSFSGSVADLKNTRYDKGRTEENVLKCLAKDPKVSTWDMSENPWLCQIINILESKGLIIVEKAEYPWHIFKPVTNEPAAGRDDEG